MMSKRSGRTCAQRFGTRAKRKRGMKVVISTGARADLAEIQDSIAEDIRLARKASLKNEFPAVKTWASDASARRLAPPKIRRHDAFYWSPAARPMTVAPNPLPSPAQAGAIAELNERSREIFRQIVDVSRHRRAGRLAQHLAHPPDVAVAGLGPQRHGGPRAAGLDLRAAHSAGRLPTEHRPAVLRRRAARDRRSRPPRSARDRGGDARRRARPHFRRRARRSLEPALRRLARRRRRAPTKHELRGSSTSSSSVSSRRARSWCWSPRTVGRKPAGRPAARHAAFGADRGRELPQRPHPRPHPR